MPIELYWENDEQNILLCEVRDQWSWSDLFAVVRTIQKITQGKRADLILDLGTSFRFPGGTPFTRESLENAKQLLTLNTAERGRLVVVGGSSVLQAIIKAIAAIDSSVLSGVRYADTIETARNLLENAQ